MNVKGLASDTNLAPKILFWPRYGFFVCKGIRRSNNPVTVAENGHRYEHVVNDVGWSGMVKSTADREDRSIRAHGRASPTLELLDHLLQTPVGGTHGGCRVLVR